MDQEESLGRKILFWLTLIACVALFALVFSLGLEIFGPKRPDVISGHGFAMLPCMAVLYVRVGVRLHDLLWKKPKK